MRVMVPTGDQMGLAGSEQASATMTRLVDTHLLPGGSVSLRSGKPATAD